MANWNNRWLGPSANKRAVVYILASGRNGTLYVGVTSDLAGRISLHKQDLIDGFTKTYGVHKLVYVEYFDSILEAIAREKRIKRWRRSWKIALIEAQNPAWRDFYYEFTGLVEFP